MTPLICDVGPRDGLQNESVILDPAVRAELVDRLAGAGLKRIEAVSFVHPKLVPAMDRPEEVLGLVPKRPGATYAGLVLNEKGYDRARAAGVDRVNYSFAVTDSFARRNQNSTVAEGVALSHRLVRRARADGLPISVVLSVCFGCPFEGRVEPSRVLDVIGRVLEVPPDEISVADTIGVGVPRQVTALIDGARKLGAKRVGAHFHNTRNTGIANAWAAVAAGVDQLDASVGGIGGCPFAPRATGNIATEDLVYLLEGEGLDTGVDLDTLIEIAAWMATNLGRELPGMVSKAGGFALRG